MSRFIIIYWYIILLCISLNNPLNAQIVPKFPGDDTANSDCLDKQYAEILYLIALHRYAQLEGISVKKYPDFKYSLIPITPSSKKTNSPFDYKTLTSNGIEINDVPKALGVLAQADAVLNIFAGKDCDDLPSDPGGFTRWIKDLPSKLAIYPEKGPKWQYDDRMEFNGIDSLLVLHFDTNLNRAFHYLKIKQNRQATVMVIHKSQIIEGSNFIIIRGEPLMNKKTSDNWHVCESVRFSHQISLNCIGTGFFIRPGVVISAAHLFGDKSEFCEERNIADIRFVQMVGIPTKNTDEGIVIPKSQVFRPIKKSKKIGKDNCSHAVNDWVIINVKQAYPGHKTKFEQAVTGARSSVDHSVPLYAFGHGLGLPMKFAFDAQSYKDKDYDGFRYLTNLDMFGGNSGSPVFDAKNHDVIGILIRGAEDFSKDAVEHCLKYKFTQGHQEHVQNLKPILDRLKKQGVKTKSNGIAASGPSTSVNNPNNKINSELSLAASKISRNEKKRYYAPYLYLQFDSIRKKHTVFVIVPMKQPQEYLELESSVVNAQTATFTYIVNHNEMLNDTFASDNHSIGGLGIESQVIVIIKNRNNSDTMFTTTLDVRNADTTDVMLKDKFCLNAPYSYLSKDNEAYYPYLLVPVEKYFMQTTAENTTTQYPDFDTKISLTSDSSAVLHIEQPPKTNTSTYSISTTDSGKFQSEVQYSTGGGTKKKKTLHPNANADEKPLVLFPTN